MAQKKVIELYKPRQDLRKKVYGVLILLILSQLIHFSYRNKDLKENVLGLKMVNQSLYSLKVIMKL